MKYFVPLLISVFVFFSCEKVVNIPSINTESIPVVNCLFSPDTIWQVSVSASIPTTEELIFLPASNAMVNLYENDELRGTLTEFVPPTDTLALGHYTFPADMHIAPQVGNMYQLRVVTPEGEATATDKVPAKTNLISTEFPYIEIEELNNPTSLPGYQIQATLKIELEDPPNENNYYAIRLYYETDYYSPLPINPPNVELEFTDSIFIKSLHYSTDDNSAVPTYRDRHGYMFSDELFDGTRKTILLDIENRINLLNTTPKEIYVEIRAISEAYYLHQKTYYEQIYASNDPFSTPTNVYENINGGLGIFAAYNSVTDTISIE